MFSAKDISIWFLYKNSSMQKENMALNDDYEVYEGITHLKLQELLYNSQGVYLALKNKRLFSDKIEALTCGPVIKNVYEMYCVYGRTPIVIPTTKENNEIIERIENNREVKEILEYVYNNYSIYTAWQLKNMSNTKNSPWSITKRNHEIDLKLIKDYFKKRFKFVEDRFKSLFFFY